MGGRTGESDWSDFAGRHVTQVVSAYGMALGMGGMAMSAELEGVDALDRQAIEAVFDSAQPDAGWHLKFASGEVAPSLVAESIGASCSWSARTSMLGLAGLSTVR